ncbi:NTE1 (YML059C) [Zygosaccharomyces parabailii]|uniref:Lysophospholipase NTE1 n=1 Tax=Zygosaccharomyces bailii (strain CLIB 213 / ATCC 58445 / CBS 680 / BCRC 21525 / NBRC 1098 / NCYC 1416 / NRRL Y-2227) TaxID=1333698 RepID=A0A8J2XAR7_ZYGB2|nr:NTE1 (YML059C) [Zygosaccharomyces parabailii]CDF91453.1 ZYBA0S11-03202g1_1 [Zygosaccharomyces bailii CLIB 213]CDH17120.1 related to Lysophospholipase NTE1 [Zygosaccharomyces bailii ISA1307]
MNVSNQTKLIPLRGSDNAPGFVSSSQSSTQRQMSQSGQQAASSNSQGWLVDNILNVTWVISYFLIGSTRYFARWSIYMVTVCLLKVPKWCFLSANQFHLTISFPAFLALATIFTYMVYCLMKDQVLSQYKTLSSDDVDSNEADTTHSSTNGGISDQKDEKLGIRGQLRYGKREKDEESFATSYLDQFLSAIRIFGYLEKPVFHDLTKNMKTQKLDEGEILLLDNSVGFSIVVEGTLQIYHKLEQDSDIVRPNEAYKRKMDNITDKTEYGDRESLSSCANEFTAGSGNDFIDNEEENSSNYIELKNGLGKFQLLNTVKSGNPVSSLVNILNLFTSSNVGDGWGLAAPSSLSLNDKPIDFRSPFATQNDWNQGSRGSNASNSPPPDLEKSVDGEPDLMQTYSETNDMPQGLMPKVIACASTDCTIAIIPPQAFAKLTAKYPRSASHIIQMILTRLYRVTFQTAHDYLGLTRELIDMEVLLNNTVSYEIPFYLKETVMKKLKSKSEKEDINESRMEKKKEQKVQNSVKKGPARPKMAHLKHSQSHFNSSSTNLRSSRHVVLDSRDHFNPGDLLSSVPLLRKESLNPSTASSTQESKSSSPPASIPSSQRGVSSTSSKSSNKLLQKPPHSSAILADSSHNRNEPNSSHANLLVQREENIKDRSFSAAEEETEESAVKMALVEAMFTYLGINKENMRFPSVVSSSGTSDELTGTSHRSSSVSPDATSSMSLSSYASPSLTNGASYTSVLRILPSDYAISSRRTKPRKKAEYKEEISPKLTFESAKNDFAQGIKLQFFKQGTTIVEQNRKGKGLFYIISGKIAVTTGKGSRMASDEKSLNQEHPETLLYIVGAGGIAGYLSSLIGYKSFVNLKAKTDCYVGFLSSQILERLCDKYFMMYLRITETLTSLLSPRLLKLDHALEWIHLSASDTLFNQGDPANGIYVVLSGRLRQVQKTVSNQKGDETDPRGDDDEDLEILGELAQGESFGEVEVLTAMNRFSSIIAVRDSELARIPRTLFELLALEYPSIMIRVSRLVARKILASQKSGTNQPSKLADGNGGKYDLNATIPPTKATFGQRKHIHNSSTGSITFRTIAILPITSGLPVEAFAMKLVQAFKRVGRSTIGLNQRTALSHLGRHAFDRLAKLKESGYFAELEDMFQTVVYIADTPVNSSWTKTCIAQGDCILLLADATAFPEVGEYEKLLLKSRTTARTELILLHPERYVEPGLTHRWLKHRTWVDSQHHVQFAVNPLDTEANPKHNGINIGAFSLVDRFIQTEFSKKTQENISKLVPDAIKARVENISSRFINRKRQVYTPVYSHKNDFLRLARILSGKAIGLVLGGGGARGISHLGFLKAIEDQGIPIDMIGGTSIGAFVGGLYAKDYDLVPIYGRVKKFAGRISSIWRMVADLTWPVTSYTTGHEFNRGIWKTFGDVRIEDFWVQYYCNSTNITESVQEIHSSGYAWRYIRASMSLAGLLPPLEDKGSMLLDGGYLDNLPVWEMKARGCDTIFAVDVGSVDDRTPMQYGDSLNGFWIVINRWNPFSSHPNIPNMAEIQMRLGYVASVNALEKAKQTSGVIYVRPPIEDYATLDFSKFEEIYDVGADYGHTFINELIAQGKMPYIPGSQPKQEGESPEFFLRRRNSI